MFEALLLLLLSAGIASTSCDGRMQRLRLLSDGQTIFVAGWFVLTSGGGSALADHPFVQQMLRTLLPDDATLLRGGRLHTST